ncbi:MAG: response regulator [Acidobacteria bacterium]|jgi:DNA-binding response OmpR family regulator|nr:response regulator [Acidobacteriota bacterium]
MPVSNPRILYVDDKDCCQMVGLMLNIAEPGYELVVVASADEAMNLMADGKFNLYVLECLLPGTSGIELCRRIRKADQNTPILFYTGMARPADRSVAMAAGATEYLVKPNDLDKIIGTITRLLNKSSSISKPESASGRRVYQGIY